MAIDLSTLRKTPVGGFPPFITIYGIDGIGKTAIAMGAPSPAYLPTEQRFGHYEAANLFGTADDPYKICGSFSEMMEAINALATQDHGFKTAVLDTVDHFEPHVSDQVIQYYPYKHKGDPLTLAEASRIPNIENNQAYVKIEDIGGYGFGKGGELSLTAWDAIYDALDNLRKQKGMAVIVLAHYHTKSEDEADGEAFQQNQINLAKKSAALLRQRSDIVFFAKLQQSTAKIGDKSSFGDNRATKAVGDAKRVLVCQPDKAYTVKNSYKMPNEIVLPEFIEGVENTHANCVNSFNSFAQYIPFFNNYTQENANA